MIIIKKNNSLLFAGVLLVCFMFSTGMRYQQFETWKKTPAVYFVDERPLMTTLDAPFWVRLAKQYNQGSFGQNENLRSYPGGSEKYIKKTKSIPRKFIDPPFLSSPSDKQIINR